MKWVMIFTSLFWSSLSLASIHDPKVMWEAEYYCNEGSTIIGREYDLLVEAFNKKWSIEMAAKASADLLYGEYGERDDQEFLIEFIFQNKGKTRKEMTEGYRTNCINFYKKKFKVGNS